MKTTKRKLFRPRVCLPVALAGLLAAGSIYLGAQQAPPPTATPATVLRVTTRLVVVDVVVQDKDGRPVTDLTQDDFVLYEDGEEQKIASFSLEKPPSRVRARKPPPLPPHVYTNRPEYRVPPGALTVLLLDALNTPWRDQAYVRQQMLDYVAEHLQEGQRTAVFALGNRLYLLQNFTSDPDTLRAVLEAYSGVQSVELERSRPTEVAPQVAQILAMMPQRLLDSLREFEQERAYQSVDRRVGMTLGALESIARATAGYPGRKNLIWVSAGFPFTLQPGDITHFRNYSTQMRRTASLLTDAQVAVYPVDARGLAGFSSFQAASGGRTATGGAQRGSDFAGAIDRSATSLTATQQTMRQLAEDTGGRAFVNRNDIGRAVELGIADGSTYYVLGYYPTSNELDGKFREIEVKVKREDVKVRHRRGYYADEPTEYWKLVGKKEEEEEQKEAALNNALFDAIPPTVVTFLAQVPPPRGGQVEVRMLVDANKLSFEKDSGRFRCNVDFLVGVLSPEGELVHRLNQTVNARLRPETYQRVRRRGLPYRAELEVEPGRYLLRLVVRDNATGLLGVTEVPLVVGAS